MANSKDVPLAELPIEKVLKLALQRHKEGQLKEAEELYNSVIAHDPRQAHAIHMLGVIAHQRGNNKIAVELISRALSIAPNQAAAQCNLGLSLRDLGRLEEAVQCYQRALSIAPSFSPAYFNQGIALHELGRLDEARTSYQNAAELTPDNADTHLNLGNTLLDLGLIEDAAKSYRNALAIQPNNDTAQLNLGVALQEMGELESALSVFQASNSKLALYKQLSCLIAFGEYDRFYELLKSGAEDCGSDLRAAAASAFISHQLGRPDPHPFCRSPVEFIRTYEDLAKSDNGAIIQELLAYVETLNAVWEPLGKTTKSGFQTRENIFQNPTGPMEQLERILRGKIEEYRTEFSEEDCDFITRFPKDIQFNGWLVRLVQGGHQTEHMHAEGWLTGTFYLQVPKFSDQEEGAIEVGLWGHDYPILNENYPKHRYYPKAGSLILFPSSLFHATIPFHSDEERLSISFDVVPSRVQ